MSDEFDPIKLSEGRNSEAWAEIGLFIVNQRPPVDEEPDAEEVEEINESGELESIDEDAVPEGYFQCDGCGSIDLEEEANSGTYGPLCDLCSEYDEYFE